LAQNGNERVLEQMSAGLSRIVRRPIYGAN